MSLVNRLKTEGNRHQRHFSLECNSVQSFFNRFVFINHVHGANIDDLVKSLESVTY